MIAVAVIAILASIALPSYQQYVVRSHRTAAQAQMMEIANLQQQYFLANRAYADNDDLEDMGYSLPAEVASRYTYASTPGTGAVPSFTITFTPIAGGPQAADGALTLNSDGRKMPANKW